MSDIQPVIMPHDIDVPADLPPPHPLPLIRRIADNLWEWGLENLRRLPHNAVIRVAEVISGWSYYVSRSSTVPGYYNRTTYYNGEMMENELQPLEPDYHSDVSDPAAPDN